MVNNGTLTFEQSFHDDLSVASVQGTGTLVKQGATILGIYGANTYTGDTIIQEGSLDLMGAGSLSSSAIH
uniref:autotransporter-associated beta strand repeat-containing protein n=1 Tax=Microvirga roseola TaxID=2883126 RepID=UPI001E500D3F